MIIDDDDIKYFEDNKDAAPEVCYQVYVQASYKWAGYSEGMRLAAIGLHLGRIKETSKTVQSYVNFAALSEEVRSKNKLSSNE